MNEKMISDVLEEKAINFYAPELKVKCAISTASTNLIAKEEAINGAEHGSIYTAQQQTAGRGRMGRNWISNANDGVYMSVVVRNIRDMDKATLMPLATALAVADAIKEITGLDTQIKWPNDVLINHKKVCGVLCEMGAEGTEVQWLVVGVGVNVSTRAESFASIANQATSILLETGKRYNKARLAALIGRNILLRARMLEENCGIIIDEYRGRCFTLGKQVTVHTADSQREGKAIDILADGALLAEIDGKIETVRAGDVSLTNH